MVAKVLKRFHKWKRLSVAWHALSCRALFGFLSKDVKLCHHMTSWRHSVMSMASHDMAEWICTDKPIWNSENHIFQPSDLVLLTYDLDLQTHSIAKVNISTKLYICALNGSAMRSLTYEHTNTDRLDQFYTLDCWRGREKGRAKKFIFSGKNGCMWDGAGWWKMFDYCLVGHLIFTIK